MTGWRFGIDRGGTFTDVVAVSPAGAVRTMKLLSEDPARAEDPVVAAVRAIAGDEPVGEVRVGTTIATNALLERQGEPVLLAITRGFGDALTIGGQQRPDIFARAIVRPSPLHARTIEVDARVDVDGTVIVPLDEAAVRRDLAAAHDAGLRAVAIVLMHGWRYPAHEARVAAIAAEVGFDHVATSHDVAPLAGFVARGDTTVADACLSPIVRRYVATLADALGAMPLFMQSSGALARGDAFRGRDAVLSGPAGGIVGMARTAAAAGFERVVGFDMGGTSTDVSVHAGAFERDGETVVAGVRIRAPMLRIHTVAAGGGSVCGFTDGRLTVGPRSAGAVPGPACYGRGGPATVTDCNVVLGKIRPEFFPAVFGPTGDAAIDPAAAARAVDAVAGAAGMDRAAAAEGLVAIAVADMAKAIRAISVGRGHDVAGFALACFGGAGGQHACLVADALGIARVVIHPLAGVLSAYGIAIADRGAIAERTLGTPLADRAALDAAAAALAEEARGALAAQGIADAAVAVTVGLRHADADTVFAVPLGTTEAMRAGFAAAHRARFGFDGAGAPVVDAVRAEATATTPAPVLPPPPATTAAPVTTVDCRMAGAVRRVPVHARAGLGAGAGVAGPALIVDDTATTVVEPGWRADIDGAANLILSRIAAPAAATGGEGVDPVRLEIFSGLFMGIAEEMGAALRHSARSVNIRERLDFSCALFDEAGRLVANAPHIPVHLGSMGDSIRTVIANRGGTMRPGDAYALNAPYAGGTHLPDITVVMPVFVGEGDAPAFFVAARGHHADVGGTTPGSMPPDSRTIDEEGVLIDDVALVAGGRFREAAMRDLLASGRWPSRGIDTNIADLKAQVAACRRGADALAALCAARGTGVVAAYMRHLRDHSAAAVSRLLARLSGGRFAYALDDGAVVCVAVTIADGRATIDFAGTSAQQPGNFNAPSSVVRAAVLYVLRTLIDEAVPMNDGCLAPVTILIPLGSMLAPRAPAAVVAGNVEVSQVVTDALFGALGAMAAAQGTMNNLTFGDETRQYYETIAGGSGAGPDFPGTSVVQTHMTNSRMTDPEILEARYPVLVEAFAIRRGSGGAGKWRGGDGAVRRLRFRAAMRAAILSNRRRVAPFGLAGGGDGAVGANRVERADGTVEVLGATAAVTVAAGDVLVIETPGGGGYGAAG